VKVRSLAVSALLAVTALAFAADAPKRHPHFDDQGTLSWSTKLSDAQAAARASGKLIFIEFGRER
jgi:hypothetical protein